jgi:hypothetical protein
MADDLSGSVDETKVNQRKGERRQGERRAGEDRRKGGPTDYCGPERRSGADRRKSPDRRLGGIAGRREEDRKAFEERIENGELTLEEVEFIRAVDRYKRKFSRPFPSWSEVLLIVKQLGYTKDSI